ncbi:exotoxin translocation ATP-binding protein PaxB [Rhodobacteraceae bacterium KLH11]|nr:exotoxin translocation ATP-binding protein PaxB [Rhodobacteraceae bacterium KLH11]
MQSAVELTPLQPEAGMQDVQFEDPAVLAISYMLRHFGFPADEQQIRMHVLDPSKRTDVSALLRGFRRVSLRSKLISFSRSDIPNRPLPFIAVLTDQSFVIVKNINETVVTIVGDRRDRTIPISKFRDAWSGEIIFVAKDNRFAVFKREFGIAWFAPLLRKYFPLLKQVLIASLLIQLVALVTPFFFRAIVDQALVHKSFNTLEILILGFGIVSLYEIFFGLFRTYLFSHTTNRIDVELGSRLFRHLLGLPLAVFRRRLVGETISRVRELETIRHFMTGSGLTSLIDLPFIFIFLAAMWYFSPTLTTIVIVSLPVYSLIAVVALPILFQKMEKRFELGAAAQSQLIESVRGIETIKTMAVERTFREKWRDSLAEYLKTGRQADNVSTVAAQSIQFVSKCVTVLILFFGAREVFSGTLTVGSLVAVNMLSGHVTAPILRLSQLWQDFQQAKVSLHRLGDIMNEETEPSYNPTRLTLSDIEGRVEFLGVTFRYRPELQEVLRRLNLVIEAGETIGIVGPSGSGKSTLTKLIQRLYVAESGRVFVDGVDLSMVDTSWLRRQIGVVLQENILFSRSIRENIALADLSLPMEEVERAAELAGAAEFINKLPDGYDTILSERGSNLSGGQRQRLAIARALVNDPKILILDEATSALDYESEAKIKENLSEICKGRTVIMIAHRLSTVQSADRIITLEKGEVSEIGTHDQLLEKDGRYAKLWKLQARKRLGMTLERGGV